MIAQKIPSGDTMETFVANNIDHMANNVLELVPKVYNLFFITFFCGNYADCSHVVLLCLGLDQSNTTC